MAKKTVESASPPSFKPASEESILKVAKEVVVKFIEVGRLTPTNFEETFRSVYLAVRDSVRSKPEER